MEIHFSHQGVIQNILFSVSSSLRSCGLQPTRLLCPWDSSGKNTAVGCHVLFQGIFLTQEPNPRLIHLLHCRRVLYHPCHLGDTGIILNESQDSKRFHTTLLCDLLVSQFSRSFVSDSLQPHGLQHARPPCPSPTPRACSNSRPSSRQCHPTISSSVVPFSSCLQSFPASGSFPMSQFFTSGGQSIGASASASVLSKNIQD